MKVQGWADIKARSMSKERIAKARRAADEELFALSLRELEIVAVLGNKRITLTGM